MFIVITLHNRRYLHLNMSTVVSFNPSVGLLNAKSLALDDLHITFHRTIRMPETHDGSYVPPSMGMFQLSRSSDYDRMSKSLTGQSGVFFPMYRKLLWDSITFPFPVPSWSFLLTSSHRV